MRLIDADALKPDYYDEYTVGDDEYVERYYSEHQIDSMPTVEPNLILPERMERDEVYDVGETITVMNHEDYMEMFCKAMMWDEYGAEPKMTDKDIDVLNKWMPCEERLPESNGEYIATTRYPTHRTVEEVVFIDGSFCTVEGDKVDVVAWMQKPTVYTK